MIQEPVSVKALATVFWDHKEVLIIYFLHERSTVNAEYYCKLLDKIKADYKSKRRGTLILRVNLLHDNARPHNAAMTRAKPQQL